MKISEKVIFVVLTIICISCTLLKRPQISDYVLVAKEGIYIKSDSSEYLVVPATLTNNTNDTLRYIVWLCPVNSQYNIDSEMLEVPPYICTGNDTKILQILPHESHNEQVKFKIKSDFTGTKIKYRLKFDLFYNPRMYIKKHLGLLPNYSTDSDLKVLWSNVVIMNIKNKRW